jgi:hypothetical protein
MSIKIEETGDGVTCVSWPIDLYTGCAKKTRKFQITHFPNYQMSSRIPSDYEMTWSFRHVPYIWERRGFHPLFSQEIQFCLKKVDATKSI